MRRFLLVLGALAIVVASFLATLLILNYIEFRTPVEMRNATRAEHARLLHTALEKHRAAHKSYPMSADFNEVSNLQRDLVGGGYLTEIPSDPQSADGKKYRYASNGSVYGLLFELEAEPNGTPAAGTCISRAKTDSASFKGFAPDCPF